MQLLLPQADGGLRSYRLRAEPVVAPVAALPPGGSAATWNRSAYAAAHVVMDPLASADPWDKPPVLDWEATLAFREHLYRLGFQVAEAMDTAQRGMGLGWPGARELIQRSIQHARTIPGARLACGVGTDHLLPAPSVTLAQVEAAYREQMAVVEAEGGRMIVMASRALAACARGPDDYLALYGRLLREASQPVILHWLGEPFDPALKGYWGSHDLGAALETVLALIAEHAAKVDGIKVSLLDAAWEQTLRRRLPAHVKLYSGDDFHYPDLIAGDEHGYSHALLGIFDPIAPIAARALAALAAGQTQVFHDLLGPTVPLARELFCAPTRYYKAGVVFLAWLNGHQRHFMMPAGLQSARGLLHYARVFELADACGALTEPDLACQRMRAFLQVYAGVA